MDNSLEYSRPTSKDASMSRDKAPLIVIFMTVFIDLVGFGIILPLSPYLARKFSATPFEIGLLMSVYSLLQFFFSPWWGGLSDRIGRRPVILISLAGSSASYLLFAFADSLPMLFVARGFAGLFGGNISAAHAYIADITTPENRTKGMGLLGAAFGLGFVFGPLIGGVLSVVGNNFGSEPPFGMSFSALGASLICAVNFLVATRVLKESLPPELRGKHVRKKRFEHLTSQIKRPVVGSLIWVFFLSGLAMAQMEAMLFPFMHDRFDWDVHQASYGFAYVGVLMVITQGYFIRKWMPRFGEPKLLFAGLFMFAVSLFGIPFSNSIAVMAVMMTLLALGNGLMRPPNMGMISLLTPPDQQGVALGVTNSLSSLGRIIGPLLGGWLYGSSQGAPFFSASALVVFALIVIGMQFSKLPKSGKNSLD